MKSFVICLALVSVVAGAALADNKELFKQDFKMCLDENKLTADDMKKFGAGGYKPEEATDNIKCHAKCLLEKRGHFKNGVFDEKAALDAASKMTELKEHQPQIVDAITKCKGEKGANECDTAFKITMCMGQFIKHK